MNRAERRQTARASRKVSPDELAMRKATQLAWRVKKQPISLDEEKVLAALMDMLTHSDEVTPEALATRANIEPIEALIYLEHFKAELSGKPNHAYAKEKLEEVSKLKQQA